MPTKKKSQSAKNYDTFAPFYDLAMGDRAGVARVIQSLIQATSPQAKSLLELGCGSGSLLKVLSKSYKCHGVDNSPAMIKIAQHKVNKATFAVADIRTLRLKTRYDVVLCAFDTINHLPSFRDWCSVFRVAQQHLNPGGAFIFDINTEAKLESYFREPPFVQVIDGVNSIFQVKRKSARRYQVHLKLFEPVRGELYRLQEMLVNEVTFPLPKITRALAKHFQDIRFVDLDHEVVSDLSQELYFVCREGRGGADGSSRKKLTKE